MFRDLISELYSIGSQAVALLVAGRIGDAGYSPVVQGVLDDLQRAVTAEPIAIYLIDLRERVPALPPCPSHPHLGCRFCGGYSFNICVTP